MRSRRQVTAENRTLHARLAECQALLAALALASGGSVMVPGADLDRVAHDADTRTLSVKVLLSGDMRVDFAVDPAADTIAQEAACSST